MKVLPFPVSFSDVPFLMFKVSEEDLVKHFGPYHDRLTDNSFTEPDTCVYWAFQFVCGLEIVITHYDHSNWVTVCADLPEVDHILRHLNFPTPNLWRIEDADPESLKNSLQSALLNDW